MKSIKRLAEYGLNGVPTVGEITRFVIFIRRYLRPYWLGYTVLVLIMFFGVFMSLFYAGFLRSITEAAVHHQMHRVLLTLALGLGMYVLSSATGFLNTYCNNVTINRIKRDVKSDLFERIVNLPMHSMNKYHSGDLLSRLQNDVDSVIGVVGNSFINLIRIPLSAGAAFFYLLQIRPQLAFVSLSFGPLALYTAVAFRFHLRQNGRRIQEIYGKMYTFVNESLGGYSVVRAFSLEPLFSKRYRQVNDDLVKLETKGAALSGSFSAVTQMVGATGFLVSLGVGALYVARGVLTVGDLLAFVSLIHQLMNPFTGAASQLGGLQRALAAAERLWNILDEHGCGDVTPQKKEEGSSRGFYIVPYNAVQFKNVSFGYDDSREVLSDISLDVPAGKVVAIVGPSGAGKSTLFHLVLNFYAPTTGRIYVNDIPCEVLGPAEVRKQIASVPQDTHVFSGTIRDNLLYGRPNATQNEVVRAARDANIHDFILSLPNGYDTEIGERGIRLSGGQKQRVAIARALLRDAPILLMDEATSALDTETERLVQEALQRLMKNRTTLVIAHRLSTIQNADEIVVLDGGRMVEHGSHCELLQMDGLYARLYRLQFRRQDAVVGLN